MDARTLAKGLAVNRIAFGAGLVLAPGLYGRTWLGRAAGDARTQVFARALGARDLALGAGTLLALRDGGAARPWLAGQAVADGTDFVATLMAGRRLPAPARAFALAMAGGSTAAAPFGAASIGDPPDSDTTGAG